MTAEFFGYAAAILGSLHMLPQFIKSIKTRSVKDVSLYMVILYFFATGLWAIYGYMINSMPVLLADGFAFLIALSQLIAKIKFGRSYNN